MNWREFQRSAPALAAAGWDRFQRSRLALVGTLRLDGSPRISPVEPLLIDGHLVLGMIWRSMKALDLERDPRCALHSVVTEPDANEGEFKLRCLAHPSPNEGILSPIRERWGIAADAPLHAFVVDILEASPTTYDFAKGLMRIDKWTPETGISQIHRRYP